MEIFENTWKYLEIFGNIGQHLKIPIFHELGKIRKSSLEQH